VTIDCFCTNAVHKYLTECLYSHNFWLNFEPDLKGIVTTLKERRIGEDCCRDIDVDVWS